MEKDFMIFQHQSWAVTRAHTIRKHICESIHLHQVHTHKNGEKQNFLKMGFYL